MISNQQTEMTDTDLVEYLATEVMGWFKRLDRKIVLGGYPIVLIVYRDKEGEDVDYLFNPLANLNHLGMVLRELSGEELDKLFELWRENESVGMAGHMLHRTFRCALLLFANEPRTLCRLIVAAHKGE